MHILNHALYEGLSLIYPPLCLHCNQTLRRSDRHLCCSCHSTMDLLNHQCHCPFCFSQLESAHQKMCARCRKKKGSIPRRAAVFDDCGAAHALYRAFVSQKQPYLAQGIAGYLAMQWSVLEWEKATVVVPMPLAARETYRKGYDPNLLLAKCFSEITKIPLLPALKFDEWNNPPFRLKNPLLDQVVILIMDRIDENFEGAALALAEGFPKITYGLAFINHKEKYES